MIKKFFIILFSSIMTLFVMSAFITKASNKPEIGFSYVMQQISNAEIGFDIQNNIEELSTSLDELNQNYGNGGTTIFDKVSYISKNIYYVLRFAIKLVVSSLVAVINIIICIVRCIGLADINYVRLTGQQQTGTNPNWWTWT